MIHVSELKHIHDLLKDYLQELPEHSQGDIKVYWAYELLAQIIYKATHETKKEV